MRAEWARLRIITTLIILVSHHPHHCRQVVSILPHHLMYT